MSEQSNPRENVCEHCLQPLPKEPRVWVGLVYDAVVIAQGYMPSSEWEDRQSIQLEPGEWLVGYVPFVPATRFEVQIRKGDR